MTAPPAPGPPAPDPRTVLRDAAITEARSLAEYLVTGPMRTQPTLARVAVVLGQLADRVEAGAAVPVPPAGLTVETLAALLDEMITQDYALTADMAAWLLPRLGSVGAPPAARRAAQDLLEQYRRFRAQEGQVTGVTLRGALNFCDELAGALRAALAASPETPP